MNADSTVGSMGKPLGTRTSEDEENDEETDNENTSAKSPWAKKSRKFAP